MVLSILLALSLRQASPIDVDGIRRDIDFLASPELEGRMTLSKGAEKAAWYISRQFRLAGLQPDGYPSFFYSYHTRFVHRPKGKREVADGFAKDVIGLSPGTTPGTEPIYIGAHYDHLGYGQTGSRSGNFVIHPGADDNASGTAGVIALAKYFMQHPHRRPIYFMCFSGEEEGLLGSEAWVKANPTKVRGMDAMINMDMIGRLREGKLYAFGLSSSEAWNELLNRAVVDGINLVRAQNVRGDSDQASFANARVPVLVFYTGLHQEYHTEKDTPDTINYPGEGKSLELVAKTIEAVDAAPRLQYNPQVILGLAQSDRDIDGNPGSAPGGQARKIRVGFIPDMADEGKGVLISGTTTGSPAEKAGFRAGDRILEFNGHAVEDLTGLNEAMKTAQPGDVVKIVFERGGKRLEATLTVEERKGG